ncbi:MAG: RIP metalloprotease RseP [Myxococcales bacterium]|nr:RIP metalloprotease RseP [Myxococcales bacterium]
MAYHDLPVAGKSVRGGRDRAVKSAKVRRNVDLAYFVVLVGVLIFVHELGHFLCAKFFDVRVLRFSLGFGPRLAGFRLGETEYRIALFPLGGYVKMLGEGVAETVKPRDIPRSFHGQALHRRLMIVLAGPLMNLLFPLCLYTVVYLGDTTALPPVIGTVFAGRPAEGVLLAGDRILSVDGDGVTTFAEVSEKIAARAGRTVRLEIERAGAPLALTVRPVDTVVTLPLEREKHVGRLGIMPHTPLPILGVVGLESPAFRAGLRTFDRVIGWDGAPITTWLDLSNQLEGNRGTGAQVAVLRPSRVQKALGGLVELDVYEPKLKVLTPEPGAASGPSRAGLELADLYVSEVEIGSPEHGAGLLPGDRVVALDGVPVPMWANLMESLRVAGPKEHRLRFRRGTEELEASFRLAHESGVTEHGQPYDRYRVGIDNWVPMRLPPPVDKGFHPVDALSEASARTWEMVELTAYSLLRLVQGRVSVKSLGGPLTIFEVAGSAAREGALNYLAVMAFISVNLGLINLLPIPLLDGGHLLFFFLEGVRRKPLRPRTKQLASAIGLIILVTLMVVALSNDMERLWPRIADAF